ncbi:MAG: hypothetical protein U9Q61_08300 [Thermodesulfobacteriota bacterium]|nr:hypothetical protein [Thermodesulfobacteriota bacterium]
MRAEKKDPSVFNTLRSERNRCDVVVERLNREIDKLPKGSLGERKVKSHGKVYVYPCLRYRDGKKVTFEHLSQEKAEALKPVLARRKKMKSDLKTNRKRIATINSILGKDCN